VTALLVALSDATPDVAAWLTAAAALLAVFVAVERRADHPIMPLDLFRHRIVTRSLFVVFMTGMAMFGAIAFIPLFVQGVMGGTATQAGQVLTPLFLGWVAMSVIGARLTVRLGYRPVALAGSLLLTTAFVALAALKPDGSVSVLFLDVFVLGCGMGLSMLSLLLAVQHGVERSQLGLATSLNQFVRSVGAAVGVAIMGAILARSLSGIDLPGGGHGLPAGEIHLAGIARLQFAHALTRVFVAGGVMAAVGLAASLMLPPVDFARGVPAGAGEQMIAAEMASLEPDDEPECIARAESDRA
jgi:predicted MFS family arabinose efflux permease